MWPHQLVYTFRHHWEHPQSPAFLCTSALKNNSVSATVPLALCAGQRLLIAWQDGADAVAAVATGGAGAAGAAGAATCPRHDANARSAWPRPWFQVGPARRWVGAHAGGHV